MCHGMFQYMDNMLREKADAGSDEEDVTEGSDEDDDDEYEEEEAAEEYSEDNGQHVRDALEDQHEDDSRNEEVSETDREGEDACGAHKSREPQPQDPLSRARAPTRDDNAVLSVSDADQGAEPDDLSSSADSQRSSGSRSPSLSVVDRTAAMSLEPSQTPSSPGAREIADKVQIEVAKRHARQRRKHHSKKGAQSKGGRPRGSKRKQDTRIKVDGGGFWD